MGLTGVQGEGLKQFVSPAWGQPGQCWKTWTSWLPLLAGDNPSHAPHSCATTSQVVPSLLSDGKQSSQPCSCHPKQGG